MVWQETVNLPTYVTAGSIPATSTISVVNSVGRVPALHAGCREFESLTMHQNTVRCQSGPMDRIANP